MLYWEGQKEQNHTAPASSKYYAAGLLVDRTPLAERIVHVHVSPVPTDNEYFSRMTLLCYTFMIQMNWCQKYPVISGC